MKRIQKYINGLTYSDFSNDDKTQDAVIRNIEIIGEAVKSISNNIKSVNPQVPWKMIAGTRDHLIHGYFGINIDIIWDIACVNIPEIMTQISKIRNDIPEEK
jgi:uncharacterized protein with HEPN domain